MFLNRRVFDQNDGFSYTLQPGAFTMSCLEILKKQGCRITPQRKLIIEYFHDSRYHISAEDIINHVQQRIPRVNKSTIYRNLITLEKAGAIYKTESDDHFIYHHAEEGHHHHLVCINCGQIQECREDLFQDVEKHTLHQYQFQANFQHLVINGLCNKCNK